MKSVITRFRAYHLGNPGSAFSYFADGHLTLIEARMTEESRPQLVDEMQMCGLTSADTLHITSWDTDHCRESELTTMLELTRPERIECPGYKPYSGSSIRCQDIIREYRNSRRLTNRSVEITFVTPDYIEGLSESEDLAFRNTYYNPHWIDPDCANDNSTVKHFRKGSFNVLSLGDVESPQISSYLSRRRILGRETDIMILAHHGADNGFTNERLLRNLKPSVAICSSDYSNMYDHPRQEIRDLLYELGIPLYTTKTGDVVIRSIGDHVGKYRLTNLKERNDSISSQADFEAKKKRLLGFNLDSQRNLYRPKPFYRR